MGMANMRTQLQGEAAAEEDLIKAVKQAWVLLALCFPVEKMEILLWFHVLKKKKRELMVEMTAEWACPQHFPTESLFMELLKVRRNCLMLNVCQMYVIVAS